MFRPRFRLKLLPSLTLTVALLGSLAAGAVERSWRYLDDGTRIFDQPITTVSPDAQVIYHILAAEMAGKRGRYDLALEEYLQAARLSDDPRLAERAVTIGLYVEDHQAVLEAARRWQELEPHSQGALQALALGLLRQGQVEQAVEHLEAIRQGTLLDTQEGFGAVSQLLARLEDKEAAARALEILSGRYPDSRNAQYHYAYFAAQAGHYDRALVALERVIELDPQWEAPYLLQAQILLDNEQQEQALVGLARAVEALPDKQSLRSGYARLLVGAERLEEAREQFEKLVELNPDDSEPLFALGLLAAEQDRYDQAVDYLTRVLERGERVQEVYFELGRLEEQRENYPKAREWYGRVTAGDRYLPAQMRLGAVLAEEGDLEALDKHYQLLRRDNPRLAPTLYMAQAETLREMGYHQAVFDLLSHAVGTYPNDEDLRYSRALAAEKVDRIDILESDLKRLIAADPDNGHALNALGYTLADRTDRYQEALGYIERALELLPEDPAVLDSMGWVQYRLGNLETALDYLRQAYAISQDAEIAAHLAEVLWHSDQREEAREVFTRALEADPESVFLKRIADNLEL
ncbi:MAG: tetratricopeptide repeat protein [Candidatus Competibacteraceae bacterium]|nr:tetratricopeptide repeat protein [Candidatus Competibacteraceae bacterium]